jgi:octaprenyl-diphosphate synthase
MNIGIAFQIIDDVLDYKSSSDDLGKEIGDDFMEGKVTLPIIIALEKANINEKSKIEEIFYDNSIKSDKKQIFFKEILNILNKYKIFNIATEEANLYYKKALINLEPFHDCFEKNALLEIAKYALTRSS